MGVLCAANEARAIVGMDVPPKTIRVLEEALEARVTRTTIGGANVVGSLVAMNTHGAVVTGFATAAELESLKGLAVFVLPHRLNAAGNNILCNDLGALVNPEIEDDLAQQISKTLGVPVMTGTIAGLNTVGSAAIATTGSKRIQALPDLPTVAETLPGFKVTNTYNLFAPAGTSRGSVTRAGVRDARSLRGGSSAGGSSSGTSGMSRRLPRPMPSQTTCTRADDRSRITSSGESRSCRRRKTPPGWSRSAASLEERTAVSSSAT